MIEILYALTVGILGIFTGAQIAEGVLFVPYWKALKAADFFELHQTYGKKIYQFFAPLTIAATFIPFGTAIYSFIVNGLDILTVLMAVFTLGFFSTYYLYFKKANQSFAEASLSEVELPDELVRWGNWHWARIYMEIAALICAIMILV